jgi:hypothetical protein
VADILERIIGPMNIPNGTSTLFTGTALHVYTYKEMTIVNETGGIITVSLSINGAAASDLILPSVPIDAGGWAEFSGLLVTTGVDTIDATADATGLTFTASGLEQTP